MHPNTRVAHMFAATDIRNVASQKSSPAVWRARGLVTVAIADFDTISIHR